MFVGLGDPFEGPAALEALANGCYFINPKVIQDSISVTGSLYLYLEKALHVRTPLLVCVFVILVFLSHFQLIYSPLKKHLFL